ncbi:ABC transporter ATP-binding protein [Sphingomonas elodea]|uniref:ABC transporter ATP-binding protein n=1 Tax=Sphingomonas elodea TaxID=179878 RepID=UPI0002630D0C|nr:ABC transporter ATP-binding protein [Sphingomonas elodea]
MSAVQDPREAAFALYQGPILPRLRPFARLHRRLLLAAVVAILASTATQLAFPSLLRSATDALTGKAGALSMPAVLTVFVIAIIANAAANLASDILAARFAQRLIFDLRRAMFAHLQQLPMSFIDRTHVGRVMSRLQGDVNALQEFLETSIIAVGDFVLLVGIAIVLLLLDWQLALVCLTLLPGLAIVRALWLPRARRTFARAREWSSIVNGALAENIAGVRVVIGTRREAENLRRFAQLAETNRIAQTEASLAAQTMTPIVDTLTGLAMMGTVAGGAWLLGRGIIDLGVLVAFIFYVQRFFDPIRTVAQQYTMLQRATTAAQRIFEVLDAPVTLSDRPDAIDPGGIEPSIVFENVSFGYRPDRPVLHGVDLAIAPHESVALVGPTGSGKSSIAALVRRLYEVDDGAVQIGGHDVRDLTDAALGRIIATVLQEPYLFTSTVAENIRYARTEASDAAVIEAARAVGADAFIRALPQGYATLLDRSGRNLSLGERQLISFARALVADPAILILDEATASIDSLAEAKIQAAMRVLLKGRTSIVIAHRLTTVRDCDRIVVLKDGRIAEQGAPAELLEQGGLYADLHRRAGASFDELAV